MNIEVLLALGFYPRAAAWRAKVVSRKPGPYRENSAPLEALAVRKSGWIDRVRSRLVVCYERSPDSILLPMVACIHGVVICMVLSSLANGLPPSIAVLLGVLAVVLGAGYGFGLMVLRAARLVRRQDTIDRLRSYVERGPGNPEAIEAWIEELEGEDR